MHEKTHQHMPRHPACYILICIIHGFLQHYCVVSVMSANLVLGFHFDSVLGKPGQYKDKQVCGMNFDKLTRYLDWLVQGRGVPAVDCKITAGYETLYRHSVGVADPKTKRSITDSDLYNIYSATKMVTVTAAMQLCEQGRLALDDRLERYLPEFGAMVRASDFPRYQDPINLPAPQGLPVPIATPIRILDLFRMTAGLSYDLDAAPLLAYRRQAHHQDAMREAMEAIASVPLLYEPGTRWAYSLAHDVLAAVVEAVSGEQFADYLRAHLFAPLGIQDMYFALDAAQARRLSTQYAVDDATGEIRRVPPHNRYRLAEDYQSGGAGLICTVDAYSRFVAALANGGLGETGQRILTMESINTLRRNWLDTRMLEDFSTMGKTGYGYGLGVRTLIDAGAAKSPVGEFGWDGAAGAYALVDTQNRLGIFMAEHVLGLGDNYHSFHPAIRDLVYEALA